MFEKLKNFISKNKKNIIKILILCGIFFLFSDFVNADTAGSTAVSETEKVKSKIISVMIFISTSISVFLGLLTYLVTMFLSPEWITGSIFNMSDKLRDIWVLVSNIVYFSFAFILIYIAFMNIIGAGGNDYEFKTALPKFIVGILIVPFSWFIVNFMVSFSSVLTIAALNLPFNTFENYNTGMTAVNIPKNCVLNLKALDSEAKTSSSGSEATTISNNQGNGSKQNQIFYCKEEYTTLDEVLKTDKASDSIFGVISLYTYGLLNLEGSFQISQEDIEKNINTIGNMVVKVVFDMVFIVAYGLLMIALGLALMVRGIWIWIYMMLSPLFGLMHFFGKGKDGFFENFNFMEFLHLCMVPVYTMLALSFGMLFIYQTGEGLKLTEATTDKNNFIQLNDKENSIKINDFSLKIEGPISESSKNNLKKTINVIGNGALGTIGLLILKIFGIVILWGTVMAALSKSNITKTMVEPIAQFGNSVRDLAKNIPQYTPILPGGASLSTLDRIPNTMKQSIQSADLDRGEKLLDNLGLSNKITKALTEGQKVLQANNSKDTNYGEKLERIISYINQNKDNLHNKDIQNMIRGLFDGVGIEIDREKSFKNDRELAALLVNSKKGRDISSAIGQQGANLDYWLDLINNPKSISNNSQNISNNSQNTNNTPKITLNTEGKFTQEFTINLGNGEQTISEGSNIQSIINLIPNNFDEATLRTELKNAKLDDSTINKIITQGISKIKRSTN